MGSPFNGWLTSEWSLSGDQAQHWRKKEKEIGVGVKKKNASEASVVSGGTIFFLFDPFFPFFSHGVAFSIEFQEWDAYFEDLRVR